MSITILLLGFYLIYPIFLLLVMSFNTATNVFVGAPEWGLGNWTRAWQQAQLRQALFNSFLVWSLVAGISFPLAIVIAWLLARTRIAFSYGLEYMFWVAHMFPSLASTVGWIMLLHPNAGFANHVLEWLPFVDKGPFNIYSLPGIIWVRIMADGIAYKVILLTPAFRNMDRSLEEAAQVSGSSSLATMLRVTVPMMISPITLVFGLQLIRVFQGFEVEQLLGARWGFYVYSTYIFRLISGERLPDYGSATVLASITFLVIAFIIPLQRWIINRRQYTSVSGSYSSGLVDIGRWRWVAFGLISFTLILLTLLPIIVIVVGSFMTRVGFFNATPLWTLNHWQMALSHPTFLRGLGTTVVLATASGIVSPLLFSVLGYMLIRTRWAGRTILDSIIWVSAAIPGVLAGLGLLLLFLDTPGMRVLYGSIWALILVVTIGGVTTGVNLFKGVFVQLGADLEEAGRVAGAGWLRTYTRIVLPVLAPSMVLVGFLNFVSAAGATSSVILLAGRETRTLSIIILDLAGPEVGLLEQAGILSLIIMVLTLGVALVARQVAARMGLEFVGRYQREGEPNR